MFRGYVILFAALSNIFHLKYVKYLTISSDKFLPSLCAEFNYAVKKIRAINFSPGNEANETDREIEDSQPAMGLFFIAKDISYWQTHT